MTLRDLIQVMTVKSKVIVPTRIEVEERKGTDILVVEDGNKEQYTTPDPYLVNWANKHGDELEEEYVGQKWKIAFSLTDGGYRDFEGFLSKAVRKESQENLEDRVQDLEDELYEIENQVAGMNRSVNELKKVVEEAVGE